jgi:hypothetical protein
MGNLVNKDLTKDDICFDYIIKELIEKYKYKLVESNNMRSIIHSNVKNTVLKIGDCYCGMIERNYEDTEDLKRLLISPFVYGLCVGKYIDKTYTVNAVLDDEYLFFAGFSHINFCKIITISSCSINTVFKEKIPMINTLCAIKPYNVSLELTSTEQNEVKLNIGMITVFKCIQYFKELGYKYVNLECHYELINYYLNLFFKLGQHPKSDYSKCRKGNPIHTAQYIIRESDKRELESSIIDSSNVIGYYGAVQGRKTVDIIDMLSFYLYFDIEKYFTNLKQELESRLEYANELFKDKKLFDDIQKNPLRIPNRFLVRMSFHDNE